MIDGAFAYPTEREGWVKTVVVGGVLLFLGFLFVPLFAAYGYLVRVIRTTIEGDPEPPAFEGWGELVVDGLQATAIGIVYQVVPAVVAAVAVGGSLAAVGTGGEAAVGAGAAGLFAGVALAGLLALAFGYVSVAGVVNFAREGRFGAAFDLEALRALAVDGDFAVAWLVSIVALVVATAITSVPLIGWVIGPFLTFYASVVAARLWGGGYRDAVGTGAGS